MVYCVFYFGCWLMAAEKVLEVDVSLFKLMNWTKLNCIDSIDLIFLLYWFGLVSIHDSFMCNRTD